MWISMLNFLYFLIIYLDHERYILINPFTYFHTLSVILILGLFLIIMQWHEVTFSLMRLIGQKFIEILRRISLQMCHSQVYFQYRRIYFCMKTILGTP